MTKRILVPVDFSAPSLQALDYAIERARRTAAEVVLLHVVEPVYYPAAADMYGIGVDIGNVYDQVERAARQQLDALVAKLRGHGARVRAVLKLGTAHRVIVDTAKAIKADMIIMSTHGRTGISRVLIGSVAERVVRTARCPVLTVPAERSAKRARRTPPARAPRRRAAARPRRR